MLTNVAADKSPRRSLQIGGEIEILALTSLRSPRFQRFD
jgi:hypothetical protein